MILTGILSEGLVRSYTIATAVIEAAVVEMVDVGTGCARMWVWGRLEESWRRSTSVIIEEAVSTSSISSRNNHGGDSVEMIATAL